MRFSLKNFFARSKSYLQVFYDIFYENNVDQEMKFMVEATSTRLMWLKIYDDNNR